MRAIERRALQSEAIGLCHGAACKLSLWSARLRENASAVPSTQDGIDAVRLHASLLQAHLSIDTVLSSFL